MTILPGETACLACLMADAPPPGTTPTCDTAGILAPIVGVDRLDRSCRSAKDPQWPSRGRKPPHADDHRSVGQPDAARRFVATARRRRLPRVQARRIRIGSAGERGDASAVLCGRNAVQLSPPAGATLSLEESGRAARPASVALSETLSCCDWRSMAMCSRCFPMAARSWAARTTLRRPARCMHATSARDSVRVQATGR